MKVRDHGMALMGLQAVGRPDIANSAKLVLHQLPRLLVLLYHPRALHPHQPSSLEELTLPTACSAQFSEGLLLAFFPTHGCIVTFSERFPFF